MKSTVIVYGATGAVGSHTANLLHNENYSLHLVGRDQDKLEKLGNELNAGITAGDDFLNGESYRNFFSEEYGHVHAFFAEKINILTDRFRLFQFYKMFLDILSNKLAIPLNEGGLEIGLESLKDQTEKLEIFRDLLFCNLIRVTSLNKDLKKSISPLLFEYQDKTVDQYYPCQKLVEFCKSKIESIMSGNPSDYAWFYDIKDFYMKEEKIKTMSDDEIEDLKSIGNKEQVKHFMDLVKQSKRA